MAKTDVSKSSAPSTDDRPAPPPGGDHGPPPARSPAEAAALKECGETIAKNSTGRPDHSAMEDCMKAKGFEKPKAPPPQ